MSKIKLVAMDLDNTLLDSEKQISKHTEEVLKEAIRMGKGIWNDAILTILQSMVYQIMY